MTWMSPQLGASNDGLLRPRVAGAQGTRQAITIPAGGLFQHPARDEEDDPECVDEADKNYVFLFANFSFLTAEVSQYAIASVGTDHAKYGSAQLLAGLIIGT